jgi:DNA-binding response OmpR family regulator
MEFPDRRILLIEDDSEIASLVRLHLEDAGFKVSIAVTGPEGLAKARNDYDLIVLDLMLPGIDGLEICRQLRTGPDYLPILMLTAKSTELDRVLGLEVGADDYLTKPFSVAELVARVKAIFRRIEALNSPREKDIPIRIGELCIDETRHRVTLEQREIELTAKEFDLLRFFSLHPGRVYSRGQLLDQVWGYGHEGYEHTVNSHINRLRAKIEPDPAVPRYIHTVWGVGYRFHDPERDQNT